MMSNVVNINKARLDSLLKKIKRQEDLIAKAQQSPLIGLAGICIEMCENKIVQYKKQIQKINEAAFGKDFMKSKNKGKVEEYYE
tara:strand:- start:3009 stop:3260 length:252 start_codon:yes stop_codon:yes gene_type:complete